MSEYLRRVNCLKKDNEQKLVFDTDISGVVTAGPGSGKTFLLTTKIAKTLFSGSVQPPQKVACLTYSRFLKNQLRNDLHQLGILDDSRIFVGTVHSFCISELIFPFRKLLNLPIPELLRIASWDEMLESLSASLICQGFAVPPKKRILEDLMRDLNKYRKLNLQDGATEFPESGEYARYQLKNMNWYRLVQDYVYELSSPEKKPPSVDFVEIEIIATRIIQSNELIRRCIVARYPWWFVDEYQDLGQPFHHMMLSLLRNTKINLIAIGDKDQCIYEEIQGSKPYFMDELAKAIHENRPESQLVTLKTNYRCVPQIIALSEAVLGETRGYVSGYESSGGCHGIQLPNTFVAQQTVMYRLLRHLTQSDEGPKLKNSQIAVLAPNRPILNRISDDLSKQNWVNSLDKEPDYSRDAELIEWLEMLASWCISNLNQPPYFIDLLPKWFELNKVQYGDRDFELEQKLFNTLWFLRSHTTVFSDWWSALVHQLNLLELVDVYKNARPDEVTEFEKLFKLVSEGERLSNWELSRFARTQDSIVLTTLYSSKGSQFEAVIIAGFDLVVYYKRAHTPIPLDFRLAYVGVTRAKKQVYLLYSDMAAFFVRMIYNTQPKGTSFYVHDGVDIRRRH